MKERIQLLTNLYFIRHAHSTYTPDKLNRPLSEKGLADAEKITKILNRKRLIILSQVPTNELFKL